MDLLGMILDSTNGDALSKLGGKHNLSNDQTSAVLAQLIPALTGGMQNNLKQDNGLDSLIGALTKGNHERYVDEPDLLEDSNTAFEGNKILGHLLGSKDNSRQLASQVEGSTGISSTIIKQLLPMAATMLMGAMSKNAKSSNLLDQLGGNNGGDLVGSLLGSLMGGGNSSSQSGSADLVGSLLKNFLK